MDIPLRTHTMMRTLPAPLRYSRTWDAGTSCIGDARDAVQALLSRARPAPQRQALQDAQLVVSELVTNAVRHASGPYGLRLELSPDSTALQISVTDTSPERPRQRPPDPRRVGGHGLHLVSLLTDGFEVTPLARGKRVTANIALTGG